MRAIEIENVGPIERLTIPLPDDGGVVVLRGRNGCGKTTALEAARALMAGKGTLPVRDACKAGHINGLGVTIRVGKTTRRGGELEAIHLEDRLSIADLVDPGLKSDDAADGRRIKALVGLTGAKADPGLFPEASRHGLDAIDDLVEQAAAAKRNLEALARAEEKRADELSAKARAMREGIPEDTATVDEAAVKAMRDRATACHREEATVRERYEQASRRDVDAARAKQRLAELESHGVPNAADAESAYTIATDTLQHWLDKKRAIEEALTGCNAAIHEANVNVGASKALLTSAKQGAAAVAALWETIDASASGPTADEDSVKAAAEATAAVERELTDALVAAGFAEKLHKAHILGTESLAARGNAAALRESAQATDDVLADAIQCPVLRVEAGRLVTTTTRGRTLFSELSEGERWRIALDIAADQVGAGGIITVPQDAWEGLDATNRLAVAEHARRRLVTILTAEAQRDGEAAELVAAAVGE